MTTSSPLAESVTRRYVLPLLLAYPLLAIIGALTHRQIFPLAALLLLLTVVMLPRLLLRRLGPWLVWLGLLAALLLLSLHGFAGLLLEGVPVLINALLAYWFGRTLGTPEPLVARFILAIEGAERLAQPGVARYARQLTWFWTLLLATQAVVLTVLLLCAGHSGLLTRFGIASPLPVSDRWAAAWLHAGGYMLLGAAFLLEYGYRRWRLRHLSHSGLHAMLLQLALHWPQLLHGNGTATSMNRPVNDSAFEQTLCIDATHPALPGHFPGDPLVPGVVLLGQVALALRAWRGQRLARVLEAKFMAPLLPAQAAMLRLTDVGTRIRFEIHRDDSLLARGIVEVAA